MKKIFYLTITMLLVLINITNLKGQSQTVIATVTDGVATLSVSKQTLIDAFEDELSDNTIFNDIVIAYSSTQSKWFIVAFGQNGGEIIKISWDLMQVGSDLFANNNVMVSAYSKCRWIQCNDCGSPAPEVCGPCLSQCEECSGVCEGTNPSKNATDGHIGNFY